MQFIMMKIALGCSRLRADTFIYSGGGRHTNLYDSQDVPEKLELLMEKRYDSPAELLRWDVGARSVARLFCSFQ